MKIDIIKNLIIKYFIANGNATNNDLAKEFSLSVPTVSKIIAEMTAEGTVNEFGKLETGEGRHPNLYGLNPDSGYFVGVDTLPDSVSLGLMNFRGDLVELSMNVPFKIENNEESLEALCKMVRDFIDGLDVNKKKVLAVCVNISGRVNPYSGYSYSMFNFSERPLTELLSSKIGYRVFIDNDSRAMAYGEYMKCDHSLVRNMLFINLSWGLGMGIIINGKVYRGKSGFSGELGHVHAFDNEVLCHCGKKGCLETQVSGRAFHRIVTEHLQRGEASLLQDKFKAGSPISYDDLLQAVAKDDMLCCNVVETMGNQLGEHIAGIINVFNPDTVVVGGLMSTLGDMLVHHIRSGIMKYSLSLVNQDTRICLSVLKEKAGVVGAAMLARTAVLGDNVR
jgi:predicted NBD/HSP70 family sugar kinase